MKLRNQLLALFCLLVFIGFGVLYFKTWVIQKPFGIILFVSDGLTPSIITAARQYEGGADHRLTIERLPHVALLTNHAKDFAVPDAAAASSAIAVGAKTTHRALAVDAEGTALQTILERAREQGRAVGLVTTGKLTNPGAAAFYAHISDSRDTSAIATQLVDSAKIDVIFGGGAADFLPESKGGTRKDGRDLLRELREGGRDVVRTRPELENAQTWRPRPLAGIFDAGELAFSTEVLSGSQQPSLGDMVQRAIEMLQLNRAGYLLIVDAALAGKAARANTGERVLSETLALDHAVAAAMQSAGEKTLILAVGRHAIGGMTLNGYPLRQDTGMALFGTNAFGFPSLVWGTGPHGPTPVKGEPVPAPTPAPPSTPAPAAAASPTPPPVGASGPFVEPPLPRSDASPDPPIAATREVVSTPGSEPAAFYAEEAVPHASDVIGAGIGPGSERLKGFLDNTMIFTIIQDSL